jgi:hypothetical protein
MKTLHLILVAFLVASVYAVPGAKIVYDDEITPEMYKSMGLVVKHLNDHYGVEHTIIKIDRIMSQVIQGAVYHFDLQMMRNSQPFNLYASVTHDLDNTMKVKSTNEGYKIDSLDEDQRRGLFTVMKYLSEKHTMKQVDLYMIKVIQTQVVSGVVYHYDLTVKYNTVLEDEKVSVHQKWSGEMEVVEN